MVSMKNIISLGLIIGGAVLIGYGINAADSLSSDLSRFFTDSPTDKTIWLLVGGIILLAFGVGRMTFGRK